MDVRNFFIPYVFEVKESIFCTFTELPCSGDLENPGQLPVLQVLEGTDNWVLWMCVISSFPTFLRSRNPFFALSPSYHVRVSKIQVNFRFYRCLRVLIIGSYGFSQYLHYFFEVKISFADIHTELPCLGDLKNLGQLPVQEVLGCTDDCVLSIVTISSQGSSVEISVMDSLTSKT